MIKPAVLNFLRAKAQEGADYTALYAQLKELASLDFDGEKKRFEAVKATRLKAEGEVMAAQEAVNKARLDVETAQRERDKIGKETGEMILNADGRAKEILAEAELQRKQSIAGWDEAIEERKNEITDLEGHMADTKRSIVGLQDAYAALKKKHDELASKHDQLLGALAAMKSSL